MLFHAGTNVISSFIPAPVEVLNGFGTYMVVRGIAYWLVAIVIVFSTKGLLGFQGKNLKGKSMCPHLLFASRVVLKLWLSRQCGPNDPCFVETFCNFNFCINVQVGQELLVPSTYATT